MHKWRVRKIPGVRMRWVDAAKRSEELPAFQLKVERQIRCLQERFFHLDCGLVVVVELEDNIGETFEVRIDRTVECQLDVARVEAALLRIMIADLDVVEISRARIGQGEHSIE